MSDSFASEHRFRLALRAARQGAWEFDLKRGSGYRSPELLQLLGVANGAPSLTDYLANVDVRDRPAVLHAFGQLRSGQLDESVLQYRFLRDDGVTIWVEQHTFVERDQDGTPAHLYGLSRDVTTIRQTELALQELNTSLEARVAGRTRELESEQAALDAFVAFTELAGSQIDVLTLATHAAQVLRRTLGEVSVAYYELEDQLWKARVWSEDFDPETVAVLAAGIPVDAPSYAEAIRTRQVVLVPGWDAEQEHVGRTEQYGAGAFFPCFVGDDALGLLAMGTQRAGDWTPREQAVFRSVGRSLTLALERSAVARHLHEQNLELEARTRALEGFSELSRELSTQSDASTLIRRTQQTLLSLLPPGYAAYWEIRDGRWYATVQVNDVGNPQLQEAIDAGLPVGQTPTLDLPYQTGKPYFQSVYQQGADTDANVVRHIHAVGCVPVLVGGQVAGIMNVPLFETRSWSAVDQVILTTTVRSLGLALEHASGILRLEERTRALERSNAELQASNEELEAFGYSVSHDLRTPVRHVEGFANLAIRAFQQNKPEKALHHLEIVKQAALRMTSLIDAMLDHSRSTRHERRVQSVELDALVVRARQDVGEELLGRDVQWKIQPLPVVQGDPALLQQVMTNLLANAVKFTRVRQQAVIEVWAEDGESVWNLAVRDNGAGFDPAYGHKLFGVFQRLHTQQDFEGTGVGLATVRRILLRHGGTITAESQVGQGATFRFTLPKSPV
ncbi:ATP-binding protein (plasmid) [Deinococcus sp. KNUC1210]|uniref:PAS domain-containing sensor histidine kinase n=1 Tax=Deinococcus sp. KNUC1210 TaxID=2917691 RepID=UPI001EF015BD|nr:ATP-binding protein [Deinococcus sp. KNUC1210]ULH13909.1 ATP-binding protein [Deinococcus sp. KNUC1210]